MRENVMLRNKGCSLLLDLFVFVRVEWNKTFLDDALLDVTQRLANQKAKVMDADCTQLLFVFLSMTGECAKGGSVSRGRPTCSTDNTTELRWGR